MTPDIEALARRAVACKGWRWLPGMLAHHPNWRAGRVSHVGLTAVRVGLRYSSPVGGTEWAVPPLPITDLLPDLSDPLTVQAVLLLAREAWNRPTAYLYYYGGNWFFDPQQSEPTDHPSGRTEAEPLVAALEAADAA